MDDLREQVAALQARVRDLEAVVADGNVVCDKLACHSFCVMHPTEGTNFVISSLRRGGIGLEVNDSAGMNRIDFGLGEYGSPLFTIRDGYGHPKIQLSVSDSGHATLIFSDPKGEPRLILGVDRDHQGSVQIYDPARVDAPIWKAP